MKIIFLDIDGVLNLIPQGFDKYGGIFHQHFTDNLSKIINDTGAKIVISSTWRLSGLQVMNDMWKFRNLPGEVIGITPTAYYNTDFRIGIDEDATRGHEIRWWLENYTKNVDNYVILDDDNDMLPEQMSNFVITSGNEDHDDCIDIGYGLTNKCTSDAIKILNYEKD